MTERSKGIAWMCVAYSAALGAAHLATSLSVGTLLWQTAWLDLVATLTIFLFSFSLNNSSMYDPYWSLFPIAITLFWLGQDAAQPGIAHALIVALIAIWGLRLTWNFLRGWPGLEHEDWRYRNIREKAGRAYWLASLGGIHLFSTTLVFVGLVGPYEAFTGGPIEMNAIFWVAVGVTAAALLIEAVADEQLRAFVKARREPGEIMKQGLWAYSRHPNYLGEIGFWTGMSLFGWSAAPEAWWVFIGPVAMTAMFSFASVPMMDKRSLGRRPEYAEHIKRVPAIFPWRGRS